MRQNGRMSCADLAKRTGELEDICKMVLNGEYDPTDKILRWMGWVQFETTRYKRVLVTETRFMPKEMAVLDDQDNRFENSEDGSCTR